jgi:hypothetical protein
MKNQLLLKQFEYSIPLSTIESESVNKKHILSQNLPLMKVGIDFENGYLRLEGNWRFLISSNKQNDEIWFNYHKERVEIETAVFSSLAINLNDPISDGLVFPLEGNIKDGNCVVACTGLLAVDSIPASDGVFSDQWNISFYLYVFESDDCEISFKFPVYINRFDERYN